jgi:hypothetical protein
MAASVAEGRGRPSLLACAARCRIRSCRDGPMFYGRETGLWKAPDGSFGVFLPVQAAVRVQRPLWVRPRLRSRLRLTAAHRCDHAIRFLMIPR